MFGKPAPELRGIAEWQGEPVKLADLRGKVVILDFWAHWCGPCVHSMPKLMELYDAYPKDKLVIIGIHDNSVADLKEMRSNLETVKKELWGNRELPFRIALSGKVDDKEGEGSSGQAITDYGITGFPTTLLIDRQGNLVGELNIHETAESKRRIECPA